MASRRKAKEPIAAYRIADRRFPIYSGAGAAKQGARWNSPGVEVIYAAGTYAGAILEKVAHTGTDRLPRSQAWVKITIPAGISVETIEEEDLPGWDTDDLSASREFGDQWIAEGRSAVLVVPCKVARDVEKNILINPAHPEFRKIKVSEPKPVRWDPRIFGTKPDDLDSLGKSPLATKPQFQRRKSGK